MKVEEKHLKNSECNIKINKLATCLPLVFRELHKGSLNNNGHHSSLFNKYNLLIFLNSKKMMENLDFYLKFTFVTQLLFYNDI